jgi:hypothetical protein
MTAGDTAQWDDLFVQQLIPSVLALVLDAWDRIQKPAADDHEDETSLRLFSAMIRAKDRQEHFFLIRLQDMEVDTDLVRVTGRKDVVFFPPANDEDIYFCLEAKRLNALVSGKRRSLADEYVKKGMQRFVDGKYSRHVRHGGMLGYVLDGDVDGAMTNVANAVCRHHESLRMEPPGEMRPSGVRLGDPHAKETHHKRQEAPLLFHLHHLFVAGLQPCRPIES